MAEIVHLVGPCLPTLSSSPLKRDTHEERQRVHPSSSTSVSQCVQSLERALGALGASPPTGGASRISLPEYQDQELLLGGWGQDFVVSPDLNPMGASEISFPEKK